MKRILVLATVFMLLATAIVPAAAAPPADEPPPVPAPDADNDVFLPLAIMPGVMLSGRVTTDRPTMNRDGSLTENPLRDVLVTDSSGRSTRTDANGIFSLPLSGDSTTLSLTKTGYKFFEKGSVELKDVGTIEVAAGQPTNGLNATAVRVGGAPEAVDALLMPNPGFDIVPYYWNPISGNAAGFTPFYTSSAYYSAFYSGFTGVPNGSYQTNDSWSRWRSHEIYIPTTTTSAVISFRVLLRTQEALAAPPADGPAQAPEAVDALLSQDAAMEMFKTIDTESENAPEATFDAQYFWLVAEAPPPSTGYVHVATVMETLQNNAGWIQVTGNVPTGLYGRTLKLEFGSVNNTNSRKTQAYFDDVQVTLNNGGGTTTCTTTQILVNENFNSAGGGWVGKNPTKTDLNDYSTRFFFSSPTSFLNGVDPAAVNPYPYEWTTGEVYQLVDIPADAVSAWLTVTTLPRSSQWLGWYSPGAYPYFGSMPAAYDALYRYRYEQQYGYIADTNTTHPGPEGIRLLFKFWGLNSNTWLRRSFNLIAYRGYPMSLLFGASNDGWGGNNALYIDDITLNVCAP